MGHRKKLLRRTLTKNGNDSEGQKEKNSDADFHILLSLLLSSRVHGKANITERSLECAPVVSVSAHPPVSG